MDLLLTNTVIFMTIAMNSLPFLLPRFMMINRHSILGTGLTLVAGPVVTGIYTLATGLTWASFAAHLTIALSSISITLIAVGLLMKSGPRPTSETPDPPRILRTEPDVQSETKRQISRHKIRTLQLLSAAADSRRALILGCLESGVSVQLAVQNPTMSVSEFERITTIKALYDIVTQVESSAAAKAALQIRLYNDRASVRLTILKTHDDTSICAILGWYTYHSLNSLIQGSPHPSLLVRGAGGAPLLRFAEGEFKRKWDSGLPFGFDAIREQYARERPVESRAAADAAPNLQGGENA